MDELYGGRQVWVRELCDVRWSGLEVRILVVLFAVLVSVVTNIIDRTVLDAAVLSTVAGLALFLPGLAVAVRRLHDTNRSGWWILIGLIPIIGWIVLIVFYVTEGDPAENRFGPPPGSGPPPVAAPA